MFVTFRQCTLDPVLNRRHHRNKFYFYFFIIPMELFLGAMYVGKTAHALKRGRDYRDSGKRVVFAKSKIDNRYATDRIATHDGDTEPAIAVESISQLLGMQHVIEADMLVLDEAQFFADLLDLRKLPHSVLVVVAGVPYTSARKPFGRLLELEPFATRVERLTGKCQFCGAPGAEHTASIVKKEGDVLVAGSSVYRLACDTCHAKNSVN